MLKLSFAWPQGLRTKTVFYYLAVIAAPCAVFLYRLASQTIGLSSAESALRSGAKLSNIVDNPINLPYKILANILYHSGLNHIFALRLGSAIFGLLFVTLFFHVLKGWFGKPIAFLTAILFALTPLYLLSARTASPNIMQASSILILAAYFYFWHSERTTLPVLALAVAFIICLYTPGLIWLILVGAIFLKDKFSDTIQDLDKRSQLMMFSLVLVGIVPLIYGFILHPALARDWLLIPASLPSPIDGLKNIAWGISSLFLIAPHVSDISIGRLPVLNAAQLGLFIFGAYVVYSRLRTIFFWMLASIIVVVGIYGLNARYEFLLAGLPFLAFLSGMGLRYLYIEWRKVFPKNPLAKVFAIILMALVVSMHALFGVRYSLLGWPATPHVKQVYVLK